MPNVIFIDQDGRQTVLEARTGQSVMQLAVTAGLDGIVAECGGNAQCATCHVYVQREGAIPLSPIEPVEDMMLDDVASPRQANSRLSCQLVVRTGDDGLCLLIPSTQY